MLSYREIAARREQHRREMQRIRRLVVALWLMMATVLVGVAWFTLAHPEAIGSWLVRLVGAAGVRAHG